MRRDVPVDIEKKTWFADLVDEILRGYDPAAALLRIPPELRGADPEGPGLEARARTLLVRSLRRRLLQPSPSRPEEPRPATTDPEDPFLGPVAGHLGLVLDIALLHGAAFEPGRRRAELAALFCALVGKLDGLRDVDPGRRGGGQPAAVQKALVRAGAELLARGHPAGDPPQGLPLSVGLLCIARRLAARLAIAYYGKGALELGEARKVVDAAAGDAVLLVEAHAAFASPLEARRRRVALTQVSQLGLGGELARAAREAVRTPRSLAVLARAAPLRLRGFLLEQLLLAELSSPEPTPARAEALQAFADAAHIPPEQVAALEADAAELYADQQRWLGAGPAAAPDEWEALGDDWEIYADQMKDRMATAVSDNIEAIITELRETGELGQLLGKAAAGHPLDASERAKVKEQLIDLAKAVPALAIFAAPGGMLLLPLLAKLLPWNVLPSAFDARRRAQRRPSKRVPTEEETSS